MKLIRLLYLVALHVVAIAALLVSFVLLNRWHRPSTMPVLEAVPTDTDDPLATLSLDAHGIERYYMLRQQADRWPVVRLGTDEAGEVRGISVVRPDGTREWGMVYFAQGIWTDGEPGGWRMVLSQHDDVVRDYTNPPGLRWLRTDTDDDGVFDTYSKVHGGGREIGKIEQVLVPSRTTRDRSDGAQDIVYHDLQGRPRIRTVVPFGVESDTELKVQYLDDTGKVVRSDTMTLRAYNATSWLDQAQESVEQFDD